jgi:hypothetical protein
VYAGAIFTALAYPPGRKPAYRINNGSPFEAGGCQWFLLPQAAIMVLHLALPVLSLALGWAPLKLVVFNALFSAVIIWVLADLVLAGLKKVDWQPAMDPRRIYGV